MAIATDEELVEVPGDMAAEFRVGRFVGQVFVEWVHGLARDGNLFEHGKSYMKFQGTELGYLLVGTRFLEEEVIGGEPKNNQAALLVGFVEFLQAGVLAGESTFAGHINDQQDLVLVIREGGGCPVDLFHADVIDIHSLCLPSCCRG